MSSSAVGSTASGSVDSRSLVAECAVCEQQLPQAKVHAHLATAGHLAQLTAKYHALAKEFASQGQMVETLRSVLLKAERSIEQLQQEREDQHPIAIFDWNGGPSDHMQCSGGATLKSDQPPGAGHVAGTPAPRDFIEISRDKQQIILAPIEFHGTFTIQMAINCYGWRTWPRYFDAQTIVPNDAKTTDLIQILAWQKPAGVLNGLAFWIKREGYDVEACIIEKDALKAKKWVHITASIDRGGLMRLYLDGDLRSTHQSRFTPRRGVRDFNRMGGKATDTTGSESDQNMIGAISALKIYNDACLTGDQVHTEYLQWASDNQA